MKLLGVTSFPVIFFPSPFGLFFSGPEQVLVNDVMPIFHCTNNIFQLIIDLRIHHNDETDGYLQNVFVLADFLHLYPALLYHVHVSMPSCHWINTLQTNPYAPAQQLMRSSRFSDLSAKRWIQETSTILWKIYQYLHNPLPEVPCWQSREFCQASQMEGLLVRKEASSKQKW